MTLINPLAQMYANDQHTKYFICYYVMVAVLTETFSRTAHVRIFFVEIRRT